VTALNQTVRDGVVKLRPAGRNRDKNRTYQSTGQLSVPAHIARLLPWGTRFKAELTDEGILFRFLPEDAVVTDENAPAWVKQARGESDAAV
jgi:hypothetical protein